MPSASIAFPQPRSPADLRRKALGRLADKFDPVRLRHKPLSLIRADARRAAEQFFDAEAPTLDRTERDRLAEDVLAALPGVGPLEELFRDDAVAEILVLAPHLVVAFKGGVWVPASGRFRDAAQLRAVIGRFAEVGEPTASGPAAGLVDVRLPTGFRAVAVLPPDALEVSPTLHLTRGMPATTPPAGGKSDVLTTPAPVGGSRGGSAAVPRSVLVRTLPPADDAVNFGVLPTGTSLSGSMSGPASGRYAALSSASQTTDPFARLRQRITEKIIMRLASAGVYDLNQVPLPELRKFVTLAVGEYCQQEKVESDPAFQQRLGLEILAGMNR